MHAHEQAREPDQTPPTPEDEREKWIGRQLRKIYDETLNEPIPDRFLDLLKQIDSKKQNPK